MNGLHNDPSSLRFHLELPSLVSHFAPSGAFEILVLPSVVRATVRINVGSQGIKLDQDDLFKQAEVFTKISPLPLSFGSGNLRYLCR